MSARPIGDSRGTASAGSAQARCPRCGSTDTRVDPRKTLQIPSALLHICNACGWRWSDDPGTKKPIGDRSDVGAAFARAPEPVLPQESMSGETLVRTREGVAPLEDALLRPQKSPEWS